MPTSQDQKETMLRDEQELLDIYRKAKMMKFADIDITIQDGVRVRLWLTEKMK